MTDLVLVPRHATKAMRRAATDAMRRFHEANPDAGWVSSGVKAGIRWEAMVEAGMNGMTERGERVFNCLLLNIGGQLACAMADQGIDVPTMAGRLSVQPERLVAILAGQDKELHASGIADLAHALGLTIEVELAPTAAAAPAGSIA